MKKSSVSCTQRSTYFQILCYALERWTRTHNQIMHGKTDWRGSQVHQNTDLWTQLMVCQGIRLEYFPGFTPLQLCNKVQEFLSNMSEKPGEFTGRIMSMFNDISWGSPETEQECELSANFVSICARRFSPGRRSFLGPGSQKEVGFRSWKQTTRRMGQSRGIDVDKIWRKRTPSFPSHESLVSRNAQKQRRWKIINTLLCRWGYGWNCSSHNSFCSSAQSLRSSLTCVWGIQCLSNKNGRPVLAWQSDPLFVPTSSLVKSLTPSTDDPAQEDLLQKYKERVDRLSQQDRVIKICTDAGFLKTVEVGQYFMTRGHWRILTNHRISGMLSVHFAKRWKMIWS